MKRNTGMQICAPFRPILWVICCCCVALNVASASELPTEPILRIDPGMHTAAITEIATTETGRNLVTASEDKTVRVWGSTDGRLLNTLRVPMGYGHDGSLSAVAMSPDELTVAVGGYTAGEDEQAAKNVDSIYLFDRTSGRMLRRLSGLPDVVSSLAFSPDGRTLAATFESGGLHLFSVVDGRLLAKDSDYVGRAMTVHFSPNPNGHADERLVTSSDDGYLRLYRFDGKALIRLARRAAPGGKKPVGVRFSPDGGRIAVGFEDTHAVNVLYARDLILDYAPDTEFVIGNLASVAWAPQGDFLYAGGTAKERFGGSRERQYIRRWSTRGNGVPVNWPVADNSIMSLAALPSGQMAFGSGEPSWGVLEPGGKRTLFHAPAVADFRDEWEGFRLSTDGSQVRIGDHWMGRPPVVFDIPKRIFLPPDTEGLYPAKHAVATWGQNGPTRFASGLKVTDWNESESPKLNGVPLEMEDGETSHSLALLPRDDGFVLGTSFGLTLFDRNGNPLWEVESATDVWGVNVSYDGHWVAAAHGDGIIRWFRTSDGEPLLQLYLHPDGKRWVMWTRSGYYDASPGAEDLIGWHVNRGKNRAADFFPASRLRERFYRPDVLSKILTTQDEAKALRLANEESGRPHQIISIAQVLPPVVEIVYPASDSTVESGTVKVRYTARTASDAPVTAMRVRVNGLLQSNTRALKLVSGKGDAQEIEVNIPEQDAEIQLFAENKYGVSVPAILRLRGLGKATATQSDQLKPKLYVLAVGVSKYKNPDYNLDMAAKDAQDFARTMQGQKDKLYSDVEVRLLTDDRATREEVLNGLDWLRQQVTAHDTGIMFVAGHGVNDKLGNYYFMPHNANPEQLTRTGVSQHDIKLTFANLPGRTVFFVDTCYSGSVLGQARTGGFINDLASAENGAVVFASSSAGQFSQEKQSWGNGAFTKSIVEGLNGKADFRKSGLITAKGLDYYVDDRVKALTNGQQTPVSISPGGVADFPIAAVR